MNKLEFDQLSLAAYNAKQAVIDAENNYAQAHEYITYYDSTLATKLKQESKDATKALQEYIDNNL